MYMNKRMKLICCDVLFRMACLAASRSRNIIDLEFTQLQSHTEPDKLRKQIQEMIDKADSEGVYEAILLGYGLCGNSVSGLVARERPLVVPRAHDCCTLFLGSRAKFTECFANRLSAQWSSHGYLERSHEYAGGTDINKSLGLDKDYAALVEQYGEENAEYIWETLHPAHSIGKDERIYIDVAPFDDPDGGDFHYKRYVDAVIAEAAKAGEVGADSADPTMTNAGADSANPAMTKVISDSADPTMTNVGANSTGTASAGADKRQHGVNLPDIQRLGGSTRLIDMLLDGEWGDDFLIVPPGMSIAPVYDMERVVVPVKPSGT